MIEWPDLETLTGSGVVLAGVAVLIRAVAYATESVSRALVERARAMAEKAAAERLNAQRDASREDTAAHTAHAYRKLVESEMSELRAELGMCRIEHDRTMGLLLALREEFDAHRRAATAQHQRR